MRRTPVSQAGCRPHEDYLPEQYTVYIGFEGEASALSNYETVFVPGLLQTQDYARAVIRGVVPAITDQQVDQRVEVRMRRQDVFKRPEPMQLWAVIDEAAIRRQVGGHGDQCVHRCSTLLTQQRLPTSPCSSYPTKRERIPECRDRSL